MVFVLEDVAVINEVANISAAEVEAQGHAWIRPATRPERDVNCIEHLLQLWRNRDAIFSHQQKMYLMDVKLMILLRTVFDGPFFN